MKKLFQILGPGLLYAGAAIGVSHLVQSTTAGAQYNFDMVWVLILANILKYPFFEFGPRYAIATGSNLVEGYKRIGNWAVILFALLTVLSMFIIQAAVTVVTVGLLAYILKLTINITVLSIIILLISVTVLLFGKYNALDKLMKLIVVLLAISTIIAVFAALGIEKEVTPDALTNFHWTKAADIFFLIAFVGWMPAPIDVSVWSSIWNLEKAKQLGYTPNLKNALAEFRIGYIGTAVLALGFLTLGALVMYGTGEELSSSGVKFSEQLINMYTGSIGEWSFWVISIAAFTTMFSTTITVLDAYTRVLTPIYQNLFVKSYKRRNQKISLSRIWLMVIIIGSVLIIAFVATSMKQMISLSMTLSFLMAPLLAWLNYRVVTDKHMPEEARPGIFLRVLSWIGIAFFVVFTFIYLYWAYLR